MIIGIDIDDVILNTSDTLKKYIKKSKKEKEFAPYMEQIIKGEKPTKEIKNFIEKNIYSILEEAKIKKNAKEVINNLEKKGNKIYIITSREGTKDEKIKKITEKQLADIRYDKMIFEAKQKGKVCKENKVNIMIDDSVKNCKDVENENIKTILFETKINIKNPEKDGLNSVKNWLELEKIIIKNNEERGIIC